MDAADKSITLSNFYKGVIEPQKTPLKSWFPIGLGIGLMMLASLLYGAYQFMIVGHHTLANTKEVPWNLFIVMYAFCISSIGLSYIASFGIVLGFKQFDVIARRALYLAILIILAGLMSVGADTRQPLHVQWLMLTTHPTSAMGIVAFCLGIYVVLITTELYLLIKKGHEGGLIKLIAIGAFICGLIVHSFHGAIFGLAYSRSFWNGPYYPIYFLLSALFCSSAIILFGTYVTYKVTGLQITAKLEKSLKTVGKLLAYLLSVGMFFLFWKMTTAWYFDKPEGMLLLSGPYSINFWVFEVLIGYLLPVLIITLSRYDLKWMAVAGFMAMLGLAFSRYDFIIIGQLTPYLGFTPFGSDLGGSISKYGLAKYSPNTPEIAFVIGLVGFIWTAYVLGVKYLPLGKDELEGHEPHTKIK